MKMKAVFTVTVLGGMGCRCTVGCNPDPTLCISCSAATMDFPAHKIDLLYSLRSP